MTTLDGFLSQAAGEPPRMTKGQRELMLAAARAVLEYALSKVVASAVLEIVADAASQVPPSTACACCDYWKGDDFCARWKQEVPKEHQPTGCDGFQDHGAPF